MSSAKQRRGLRTKTGCLTCKSHPQTFQIPSSTHSLGVGRSRRKKCDEISPVCGLCDLSKRQCRWPTTADLVDRRYTSHHDSRHSFTHQSNTPTGSSLSRRNETQMEVVHSKWPHAVTLKICLLSESTAHQGLSRDIEIAISRHFIEKYYGLLLLPNCHPDFYDGWITEIQYLMINHESLRYSVLANGASHLHFIKSSKPMQELALTYYSNALKDLSSLLARPFELENHNGLLMSTMLLYLHGVGPS